MTETPEPRSERVDLRMTPSAKRTLQRAAAVSSEFMLDSSLSAAFDTLADRRVFQLDEVQWAAFIAALDTPPRDNPGLRKLLMTRAPWDPERAPRMGASACRRRRSRSSTISSNSAREHRRSTSGSSAGPGKTRVAALRALMSSAKVCA
jgi:uncharacterized protein (DUF1778 family)